MSADPELPRWKKNELAQDSVLPLSMNDLPAGLSEDVIAALNLIQQCGGAENAWRALEDAMQVLQILTTVRRPHPN